MLEELTTWDSGSHRSQPILSGYETQTFEALHVHPQTVIWETRVPFWLLHLTNKNLEIDSKGSLRTVLLELEGGKKPTTTKGKTNPWIISLGHSWEERNEENEKASPLEGKPMKAGRSSTGAVVEGGLQAGSFRETVRKYSVSGKAFRGINQYLKEKETLCSNGQAIVLRGPACFSLEPY